MSPKIIRTTTDQAPIKWASIKTEQTPSVCHFYDVSEKKERELELRKSKQSRFGNNNTIGNAGNQKDINGYEIYNR